MFELKSEKIAIPVLARIGDPWSIKKNQIKENHDKYKITAYFGYVGKSLFEKYYGKKYQYKTILWGLENSLYENIKQEMEKSIALYKELDKSFVRKKKN